MQIKKEKRMDVMGDVKTVLQYIDKNYSKGDMEIYIEYDYELSDNIKSAIVDAKSREEIEEELDNEYIRILELNEYDMELEILDNISEVYDALSENEKDEVLDYIRDKGIISLDIKNIIKGDIDINIFPFNDPANEEFDFYDINDLKLENENVMKIMEILKVNPYDVGEILKNRGDIKSNNFPNIKYQSGNSAKEFFEEVQNGYGGNSFMITAKLDIADYYENFNLIKERGLQVPAGAKCGLINTVKGSCSFASDIEIPDNITLKNYHMYNEDNMPGYGLDEIAGVVRSYFWNTEVTVGDHNE